MAPTPSLARLSLIARTGGQPADPKARRNERAITKFLELLPEELWDHIVTLAIDDGECAQLDELCKVKGMPWSGWCEDGSIYERVSARLGWYGDLPNWKAVQAHYNQQTGVEAPQSADAYFRHVCAQVRLLRNAHERARRQWGRRTATFGKELRRLLLDSRLHDWYPPYVASLAKYAVGLNWEVLEYVPGSIDESETVDEHPIRGYAEVALEAVRAHGVALQFVPGSIDFETGEQRVECIDGYVGIAARALRDDGMALAYVPGSRIAVRSNVPPLPPEAWYAELATIAVQTTPSSLNYVPHTHPEYVAIAEVAMRLEPSTLFYVPADLPDYAKVAEVAIRLNPDVIDDVPSTYADYDALEALAERVRTNPS